MPGPVLHLTLLAAVGDGVTIFADFTLLHVLVIHLLTLVTFRLGILPYFGHVFIRKKGFYLKFIVDINTSKYLRIRKQPPCNLDSTYIAYTYPAKRATDWLRIELSY